ncbi:hypothetical protein ACQZET_10825 [Corynebacterium diphtheriae]|uniref:hypothetical protein n=1 Tax=Corynebacterium diphtheriae TaxID=1717 RepID=UPI0040420A13
MLEKLIWKDAAPSFDQTGTLFNTQIVTDGDDHPFLILAFDLNKHGSSLAYLDPQGQAYDTQDTRDWPMFDRLFTRKAWQKLIAEHEAEALEDLKGEDD